MLQKSVTVLCVLKKGVKVQNIVSKRLGTHSSHVAFAGRCACIKLQTRTEKRGKMDKTVPLPEDWSAR